MKILAFAGSVALAALGLRAELIPSTDGQTVYDTILHVTWLTNANLAASKSFSVANITPNGAMNYATASQWVAALNAANYLGHNNWQIPATPPFDSTCTATGPNNNNFGYNCTNSAMGSLFYQSLGLQHPNTAVPIPSNSVGPFSNFQPYLYWSATPAINTKNGYNTFSFNTGWEGQNVDNHYMYALPMIKGKLAGSPPTTGNGLQPSADGTTVYDPMTDVTWLANADLAKSQTFTAQCSNHDGTLCINPDGSMSHTTALAWVGAMNAAHYLGQTTWQLPPVADPDPSCTNAEFGCTGYPLGNLFYNQLHLSQGTPVVPTPGIRVGPFQNLQPYLYWSCETATGSPVLCGSAVPAPNFEWSFSFGNGFEGTDLQVNDLYVMIYAPDVPRHRAAHH